MQNFEDNVILIRYFHDYNMTQKTSIFLLFITTLLILLQQLAKMTLTLTYTYEENGQR